MSAAGFARCALPDPWEIEGSARFFLSLVLQDGADQPDVVEGLRDLGFLVVEAAIEGKRGWTDFVELVVYYRGDLDGREELWTQAHEAAHVIQELEGLPSEFHDEAITDQIARAILMPEAPYRRLVRRHGAYHPIIDQKYGHVPPLHRLIRAAELGF